MSKLDISKLNIEQFIDLMGGIDAFNKIVLHKTYNSQVQSFDEWKEQLKKEGYNLPDKKQSDFDIPFEYTEPVEKLKEEVVPEQINDSENDQESSDEQLNNEDNK